VDNEIYELLAIQYESWKKARMVARNANKQNRIWDGAFLDAFSYGKVCIFYPPSDENLGQELLSVLEANYQSQTK